MLRRILVATSLLLVPVGAAAQSIVVPFQGEIVDESLAPVSGVFPMAFNVYENDTATDPLWTESQYVAVWEGQYTISLGVETAIPSDRVGSTVSVGVELGSFGEVARQSVALQAATEDVTPPPTVTGLVYAHIADHAVEAETAVLAADCETLGGRTPEELDRFEELQAELSTLERELEDATTVRVGSRTVLSDRVGGTGGAPYDVGCEPGYVVTGIRGRAGDLIDALELVCSPLQ